MRRSALVAVATALAAVGAPGAGAARDYTPPVNYALHCRGCHLADGSETPGRVPALAGSMGRFLRVPGGRAYLVRVPGAAQSPLADAPLAALLNWMLVEFSSEEMPADFTPYTAKEVARYRSEPLVEVEAARRALLEAIDAP